MTTPNFTPDVPQWCRDAAVEIKRELNLTCVATRKLTFIIARHAPQPEATPAPAATDAGEVPATPKWPRYFEDRQNRRIESRVMFTSESDHGRWADGFGELKSSFRDYAKHNGFIETDAEGNALSNSPETDEQRASRILGDPMRRVEMNTRDETPAHPVCRGCNQPLKAENAWMSDGCPCNNPRGINHGLVPKECCTCDECSPQQQQASGVESKVDEVVMLAQDAAFARRDKSLFMVKEGSKFVSADRFIEAEAELASIKREYIEDASTNRQRIDDHEVLIAKLRRRLAARDATIAELTKSGEQASSIRDGALAVCKNSHELVLGLINERNGLKKQLAAANERVAVVEKERDGLREQVYELKNGDQP